MRPESTLRKYLNDFFVKEIWKAGADLLGNTALSELDKEVRAQAGGPVQGLTKSSFDLDKLPGARKRGNDLVIRIPTSGRHRLKTDIYLTDPIPDPTIEVDFSLTVKVRPDGSEMEVDADVDISGALGIYNLVGLFTEGAIEDMIKSRINGVGGLNGFRFNHQINAAFPAITLVKPKNFDTNFLYPEFNEIGKDKAGFIDLLFIADGYMQADIDEFETFTEEVADFFYGSSQYRPFSNFSSNIRLWRSSFVVNDPDDINYRLADAVTVAGVSRVQFANLALLAEYGLTARQQFKKDPIVIIISKKAMGVANCQGPYVLLRKGTNNETAREILIHELGHTNLGKYLADEYNSDGGFYYRGLEPVPRNVTTHFLHALIKWGSWLPPGQLPLRFEGAYRHKKGIYRFQEACKMKDDRLSAVPFCPICQEELTLGMLRWGHEKAGKNGIKGMAYLKVEYQEPGAGKEVMHISGGESASLKVIKGLRNRVVLTLMGTSVPKQREVKWEITDDAYSSSSTRYDSRIEVSPKTGTAIRLTIRHLNTSSGLIAGNQTIQTSFNLIFNKEVAPTKNDLNQPYDLIQSIPYDTRLDLSIVPETGALKYKRSLWVAGSIGGFNDFHSGTYIDFVLERDNGVIREKIPGGFGFRGERRRWRIVEILPPGTYNWKARTRWRGEDQLGGGYLLSDWQEAPANNYCFEIGAIPFETNRTAPKTPFDLRVVTAAPVSQKTLGLSAASWHPNDRSIKFQFEIKPKEKPWTGRALTESEFLKRKADNYQSLKIEAMVALPEKVRKANGKEFKWRVRATDGEWRSGWAEGGTFIVRILGAVELDEWLNNITDPRLEVIGRLIRDGIWINPIEPRPGILTDPGVFPRRF